MNGYLVIVEQGEDATFGVWLPDLPGCVAVADTDDECVALISEAVPMHLELMREHGDPIPGANSTALTISAA